MWIVNSSKFPAKSLRYRYIFTTFPNTSSRFLALSQLPILTHICFIDTVRQIPNPNDIAKYMKANSGEPIPVLT